jgi:hypothetical protein
MEAAELFSYNRENFKFNKELRQKKIYQQQYLRVHQVLLYRDDLRDLFGLTIGKMDAYMMVNVLLLGCAAEMYFKGKTPATVPEFLFWFWGVSLAASFFFLFYSTWLAIQASVLSHTYMARCLTQWLRLPVPSISEINAGSSRLEDYEKNTFLDFVRPPVVVPMGKKMGNNRIENAGLKKDLSTHWTEFIEHFELFNSLHNKWQSHEAYARVGMCLGTYELLCAFSYFALIYVAIEYQNPFVGGVFVILTTAAQLIFIRMSLNSTRTEHYVYTVLIVLEPILVLVACILSNGRDAIDRSVIVPQSAQIIACVGYVSHFLLTWFFHRQTYHDDDGLPMKFSTVWCINILGFDMETIRDIEEPRVDFPGFVQPARDPRDRPLNTYDLSHAGNDDNKINKDEQNASLPSDVIESCRKLEAYIQRLFGYWGRKSHELSSEELAQIEELKEAFSSDSEILRDSVQSHMNRLIKQGVSASLHKPVPGIATDSPGNGQNWIRLAYETDEIQWESGIDDALAMEIARGLSLLPEQLEMYHANVRKIEYASKREHALERQKSHKPPTWVWRMFQSGMISTQLCWIAAFLILILEIFNIKLPK